MPSVPSVRVFAPDEWRCYGDLRLQALADSPDAFGSTLAAESGLPDDEWAARLGRGTGSGADLPLIAELDDRPAGLAWARIDPADQTMVRLFQMWVAPGCRGCGAGRMLLATAIDWARNRGAQAMLLGVSCGDTPAARLYTRAGFVPVGIPEPLRAGADVLALTLRLWLGEAIND